MNNNIRAAILKLEHAIQTDEVCPGITIDAKQQLMIFGGYNRLGGMYKCPMFKSNPGLRRSEKYVRLKTSRFKNPC